VLRLRARSQATRRIGCNVTAHVHGVRPHTQQSQSRTTLTWYSGSPLLLDHACHLINMLRLCASGTDFAAQQLVCPLANSPIIIYRQAPPRCDARGRATQAHAHSAPPLASVTTIRFAAAADAPRERGSCSMQTLPATESACWWVSPVPRFAY
jgi:hypothetical protein